MRKLPLIVAADQFVPLQKLVGTEKEFSKIDNALSHAELFVKPVEFKRHGAVRRPGIQRPDVRTPFSGFLMLIDEVLDNLRLNRFLIDPGRLHHPLHNRELVRLIDDLKTGRQPSVRRMHPKHPVAETVERADPHAARIHFQHRLNSGQHFA